MAYIYIYMFLSLLTISDISYFYLIEIIYKMFYLTHGWDSNRFITPGQSEIGINDN